MTTTKLKEATLRRRAEVRAASGQRLLLWFLPLLFLLGTVYWLTLLPGISVRDDLIDVAEFQFVGSVLGVPHWTGYPTYVLLNHFFVTWFPFGSLAFKANLLSAVFAVGAAWFCFLSLTLLRVSPRLAFVTALSFGLTPTLWSQALIAEVYTLHVLFGTAVTYYAFRWYYGRQRRFLLLAAGLYAFSFGNHLTTLFLLPAFFSFVLLTDRRVFRDWRLVLGVFGLIALGAAQYLYVWVRGTDPTTPFAYMPLDTFGDFVNFVTGRDVDSLMFPFSFLEVLTERIPLLAGFVLREFTPLLLVFCVLGFFSLKDRRIHAYLLLYFLANSFYCLNYDIFDIVYYMIPSYFVLIIYMGLGLQRLNDLLEQRTLYLPSFVFLLVPFLLLGLNYRANDMSGDSYDAQIVSFLSQLEDNSLIVTSHSWIESTWFWYYLLGEGYPRDTFVLHRPDSHKFVQDIRAYVYDQQPLHLFELRRAVAPGRSLFHQCSFWQGERGIATVEGISRRVRYTGLLSLKRQDDLCQLLVPFTELRVDYLRLPVVNSLNAQLSGELKRGTLRGSELLLRFTLEESEVLALDLQLQNLGGGQRLELELNGQRFKTLELAPNMRLREPQVRVWARAGENLLRLHFPDATEDEVTVQLEGLRLLGLNPALARQAGATRLDYLAEPPLGSLLDSDLSPTRLVANTHWRWVEGQETRLPMIFSEAQPLELAFSFYNPRSGEGLELRFNGEPLLLEENLATGQHERLLHVQPQQGFNELLFRFALPPVSAAEAPLLAPRFSRLMLHPPQHFEGLDLLHEQNHTQITKSGWGTLEAGQQLWGFGPASSLSFSSLEADSFILNWAFHNPFEGQSVEVRLNDVPLSRLEGLPTGYHSSLLALEIPAGQHSLSFHYGLYAGNGVPASADPRAFALLVNRLELNRLAPFLGLDIFHSSGQAVQLVGWSKPEIIGQQPSLWSFGPHSDLHFISDRAGAYLLELAFHNPFEAQRVIVEQNGVPVASFGNVATGATVLTVPLEVQEGLNQLSFGVEHYAGGGDLPSPDGRPLAMQMRKLTLRPLAPLDVLGQSSVRDLSLEGWSGLEGNFRWSFGPRSSLRFSLEEAGSYFLNLEALNPFEGQGLTFLVNGQPLRTLTQLPAGELRQRIPLELQRGENDISILSSHYAGLPGLSLADGRPLALQVYQLTVTDD